MNQLEKESREQPETAHQGCSWHEAEAAQKDGVRQADSHNALRALHSFRDGLPVCVAQAQLPRAHSASCQASCRVKFFVPRGEKLHWHGLTSPHNKAVRKVCCNDELVIDERDV